jgi:DNA-binding LytR/AlgR family response regulator
MSKLKVLIVEDVFEHYNKLATFFTEKEFYVIRPDDEDLFVDSYELAVELCATHDPDIAILDIGLNSKNKDGIELAIWLKEQFNIPILFLTSRNEYGSLERIKKYPDFRYYQKAGTKEKLNELWFTVQQLLAQPKVDCLEHQGIILDVQTVPYYYYNDKKKSQDTFKEEFGTYDIRERLIRFSEIQEIKSSNNEGWGKNKIVIIEKSKANVHFIRTTLNSIEKELPYCFVRISNSMIIYGRWINSKGSSEDVYFMDDTRYEVKKDFEGRDLALRKMRRIYGR